MLEHWQSKFANLGKYWTPAKHVIPDASVRAMQKFCLNYSYPNFNGGNSILFSVFAESATCLVSIKVLKTQRVVLRTQDRLWPD